MRRFGERGWVREVVGLEKLESDGRVESRRERGKYGVGPWRWNALRDEWQECRVFGYREVSKRLLSFFSVSCPLSFSLSLDVVLSLCQGKEPGVEDRKGSLFFPSGQMRSGPIKL